MSADFTRMTDRQVLEYATSCFNFAPVAFPQTAYAANRIELDRTIACLARRGIEVVEQIGDQRSITFFWANDETATPIDLSTLV